MDQAVNAINWFEIPVSDFARAKKFYSNILNTELFETEMNGRTMAFFPSANGGVGGSICHGEGCEPAATGTCVFINGLENLDNVLSKVVPEGGQVMMPKTNIGEEAGNIAYFMDTEGNKVGLHSMQ